MRFHQYPEEEEAEEDEQGLPYCWMLYADARAALDLREDKVVSLSRYDMTRARLT